MLYVCSNTLSPPVILMNEHNAPGIILITSFDKNDARVVLVKKHIKIECILSRTTHVSFLQICTVLASHKYTNKG